MVPTRINMDSFLNKPPYCPHWIEWSNSYHCTSFHCSWRRYWPMLLWWLAPPGIAAHPARTSAICPIQSCQQATNTVSASTVDIKKPFGTFLLPPLTRQPLCQAGSCWGIATTPSSPWLLLVDCWLLNFLLLFTAVCSTGTVVWWRCLYCLFMPLPSLQLIVRECCWNQNQCRLWSVCDNNLQLYCVHWSCKKSKCYLG